MQEKKLWGMKVRSRWWVFTGMYSCCSSREEDKPLELQLRETTSTQGNFQRTMVSVFPQLQSTSMHREKLLQEEDDEPINFKDANKNIKIKKEREKWILSYPQSKYIKNGLFVLLLQGFGMDMFFFFWVPKKMLLVGLDFSSYSTWHCGTAKATISLVLGFRTSVSPTCFQAL